MNEHATSLFLQVMMDTFADRIKSFRKSATTAEFAKFLGISGGALNNYERGASVPGGKKLIQISERLGVKVEWLLHGTGTAEKKEGVILADLKGGNQNFGCQRCLDLYEKLVQTQEREMALVVENAKLTIENAALKVAEKELRAELSLSASASGESTSPSAA